VRRTQRSTFVRVCLALAVFLQTAAARETASVHENSPTFNTRAFVIQMTNGHAACRAATRNEAQHANPSPGNRGVPIAKLQGVATPLADSPTGLTINLVALSQLQTDSNRNTVIAAFQRAAATWSARIKTPITITINVDYGFNMPDGDAFPDGVVGSTGSGAVTVDYSLARANLSSTAASPTESTIYNSLPASSVSVNTGIGSAVEVARSLGQALGFVPLAPNTAVATISFNKDFPFDFNPDNGINSSSLDFVGTATHEIGHALGFISNAGGGSGVPVTTWDLFRFRTGTTPSTFATAQRIMTTGGSQVYYTTQSFVLGGGNTNELRLSTGGPDGDAGDGNQSSHWKADELTGQYIGIMDPTIDLGERMVTTENDFSALETFGWNLVGSAGPPSPPPPADNDNFANAFLLVGCSGTALGANLNATRENAEPNHLSLSNNGAGTHSLWYLWQAPSTGSVNFTTAGSAYDTVLAVYTGTNVDTLTVVAQNDDIPDVPGQPHQVTSSITFSVVAGNIYRIAVDGFNNGGDGGDMGPLKLNWFQSTCNEPARFLIPEDSNPNLLATFDSVTFVRGPLHISTPNNFDSEHRTRIMFLIQGLTFTPADSAGSAVTVQAGAWTLTVNNLGSVTAPGFSATYVVAALPLGMPAGDYPMRVTVKGVVCSNSPILQIAGP
jgi:hypothetical protein